MKTNSAQHGCEHGYKEQAFSFRDMRFCLRAREVEGAREEKGCRNEFQSQKVTCPTPDMQALEIKATATATFSKQKVGVEFLPVSRQFISYKIGYGKGH